MQQTAKVHTALSLPRCHCHFEHTDMTPCPRALPVAVIQGSAVVSKDFIHTGYASSTSSIHNGRTAHKVYKCGGTRECTRIGQVFQAESIICSWEKQLCAQPKQEKDCTKNATEANTHL